MSETERDLIQRVTRAVRQADQDFEDSGGSSRHWVIECFLPRLEEEGVRFATGACPICGLSTEEVDAGKTLLRGLLKGDLDTERADS